LRHSAIDRFITWSVTHVVASAGTDNQRLFWLANDSNPRLARHVDMGGSGGSEMYYYYIIEFPIDIIIDFTATTATTSKTADFG
jgi:hypothetical protein